MSEPTESEITRLLRAMRPGEPSARASCFRSCTTSCARSRAPRWRARRGRTLQATELVHEAWLRVAGGSQDPGWSGRAHFFGAAARAMRRILVEQARRKGRLKRGGGVEPVELDEIEIAAETPGPDFGVELLAVEEALARLEREDERKGRIVELRYFAGLTVEETAQALGVSVGTIERDWRFIRAWLQDQLGGGGG
jgi:RNA polymerase sigma factor (TIGR02999 family)